MCKSRYGACNTSQAAINELCTCLRRRPWRHIKNHNMKLRELFTITRVLPLLTMLMFILAGCDKDEDPSVRPKVTATNPVNQGTNIALNTTLATTFNVEMDPASINTST